MLSPEVGQASFRLGLFITLVSAALLFFQTPGTAEFVLTVTTLGIGTVFLLIIAILVRRSNR